MELNEFIKQFANQFDDTDVSEIRANTVFKDLDEWSSLIALSVIAFVKTEYGKSITGSQIRSCVTVSDLFNLVSSL
jgi:acyl carrier protein